MIDDKEWDSVPNNLDNVSISLKMKMAQTTVSYLRMLIISIVCLISLSGCAALPKDTLTQVSIIDALLAGGYDGQLSCGKLLKYGDFGLGTFDKLNGEMVVLDGRVYQIKADGHVYTPDLDITTPFAAVSRFQADKTFSLPQGASFQQLKEIIDREVPNTNIFCGIKLHGTFSQMKTRSVPAQEKPYPPLTEVVKNQPVFTMENVSGTVVGFRCPAYVKGLNVPGYHLHFLSDDLTQGGHILDLTTGEAAVSIDTCNKFFLIAPKDANALIQRPLAIDRGKELEQVEK